MKSMKKDRSHLVIGLLCAGMGLFPVLASVGVIHVDESYFHAPRWVVAAGGGVFLVTGLYLICGAWLEGDMHGGVQFLFICVFMVLFAAPFHWAAFGPGKRNFSGGISIPFIGISFGSPELLGRIVFGIGAIMLDVIFVFICWFSLKRWLSVKRN